MSTTDLVLAFDADCRRCRAVAATVARTCPTLTVLPLTDYRVSAWRGEAGSPPWAPTLLSISPGPDGDVVRARTGPALVPALVARLGVRRGWTVLGALRREGLLPGVLETLRTPSPGHDA